MESCRSFFSLIASFNWQFSSFNRSTNWVNSRVSDCHVASSCSNSCAGDEQTSKTEPGSVSVRAKTRSKPQDV